jgi:multicomponent Na+:H+ antiporter subunit A
MWLGPVSLGGLGLVFGIIPNWVGRWLIEPAVRAFHPSMEDIQLKLFYGINEPLLLSILTLSLGVVFYIFNQPLRQFMGDILEKFPIRFEYLYTIVLDGIATIVTIQTRILQNGSLHRYLCIIIGSVVLGVGLPFLSNYMQPVFDENIDPSLTGCLLVGIISAAVMMVVKAGSRLLAICSLGVVGAGIAMLFLMYGAPDIALTQLLVETLTVIVVSLVLLRLPSLKDRQPMPSAGKLWNGILAVATGALITALILAVNQIELDRSLTDFFEAKSYIEAHGRNVVNVILVDFRSFDTLGEITVVALAGLAGYALIQKRKVQ